MSNVRIPKAQLTKVQLSKVQLSKVQRQAETVSAEASQQPTVCVLCSQNCGLVVDVKDNCITKIQADKSNPITLGYSCNKAYSIGHYVNHQQRVEQPLKRQADGSYKAVSWDLAISEIATRFNDIRKRQGPKAIALNGIGGQANHMDALFATGFMNAIGSPWVYNSYAQEKTQHHWVDTLMMNAPVADMYHPNAWNSQTIFMMGTNPLISNRNERATENLKKFLKNEKNTLIVVDPRVSETARRADTHLQLTPAGDAFLLMAMIKVILDESLFDSKSLQQQTKNFSQLEAMFTSLDVTTLAEQCGLDALEIRDVARQFASASSACVFYDLGIEQIQHSTLVSWLIRVLVLVTGNFERPGAKSGGNHLVSGFSPDGSALQPKQFPKTPVSGVEGIPAMSPYPMYSPFLLPEEIEAGNIHGLIVEGSNPLLSYGDTTRFKKALESLELLVVIEPAMTETARVADYVLPTPVGYEKWEWSSFPKGYPGILVQLRPPVVTGPKNALPEGEIYYRLAMAMGVVSKPPFVLKQLGKIAKGNRATYAQALLGMATVNGRGDPNKSMANMVF
ncbi:MAG: molybdopterin-dependent oxidoreductase, partial [Pseudomonadales bacterium]|nr:molybdopterin-dependent oxidoreductase [Pseudomonadales bacterium]